MARREWCQALPSASGQIAGYAAAEEIKGDILDDELLPIRGIVVMAEKHASLLLPPPACPQDRPSVVAGLPTPPSFSSAARVGGSTIPPPD